MVEHEAETDRHAVSLFRCLVIFAGLGPVVGYVVAIAGLTLEGADDFTDLLRFPLAVVLGAIVALPAAFLVGFLPALFTGGVFYALRARIGWSFRLALPLTCAAALLACAAAATLPDWDFAALLDRSAWIMVMLPGLVATAACALVAEREA